MYIARCELLWMSLVASTNRYLSISLMYLWREYIREWRRANKQKHRSVLLYRARFGIFFSPSQYIFFLHVFDCGCMLFLHSHNRTLFQCAAKTMSREKKKEEVNKAKNEQITNIAQTNRLVFFLRSYTHSLMRQCAYFFVFHLMRTNHCCFLVLSILWRHFLYSTSLFIFANLLFDKKKLNDVAQFCTTIKGMNN